MIAAFRHCDVQETKSLSYEIEHSCADYSKLSLLEIRDLMSVYTG